MSEPWYDDGQSTIYCGKAEDVLPCLDPDDFGVMLADPPYGINYRSGMPSSGAVRQRIKNDGDTSVRDFILKWWGDRPALVFGSWRIPAPDGTKALLVWDKKGALGMGDLRVPWKPSFDHIFVLRGHDFDGRRTSAVLSFAPVQSMARNGRLHPHQKPLDLLEELISKCPQGPIIDPTMGVGSTLLAARNQGRKAVGIEMEEGDCEIAVQRLRSQR